jgi:hypothetical protein
MVGTAEGIGEGRKGTLCSSSSALLSGKIAQVREDFPVEKRDGGLHGLISLWRLQSV